MPRLILRKMAAADAEGDFPMTVSIPAAWSAIRAIAVPILIFFSAHAALAQSQPLSPLEKDEIKSVVREYILENPEIIVQAIGILQQRERENAAARTVAAIQSNRATLENDGISPVMGNPDGDVTIVEFFDYRCIFCRRAFEDVHRLVDEDKNIRLVYRQFPIKDEPGAPAVSKRAAEVALVAAKHGKFDAFHERMMAVDFRTLTIDKVMDFAAEAGLDIAAVEQEITSAYVQTGIRLTYELAQQIGVTGTPGFVIGDQLIVGAQGYDALKQAVAQVRQKRTADAP